MAIHTVKHSPILSSPWNENSRIPARAVAPVYSRILGFLPMRRKRIFIRILSILFCTLWRVLQCYGHAIFCLVPFWSIICFLSFLWKPFLQVFEGPRISSGVREKDLYEISLNFILYWDVWNVRFGLSMYIACISFHVLCYVVGLCSIHLDILFRIIFLSIRGSWEFFCCTWIGFCKDSFNLIS